MSAPKKNTYVVLRQAERQHGAENRNGIDVSLTPISGRFGSGSGPQNAQQTVFDVSLQHKTAAEAQQLREDPGTLAIATQMPLIPIEPCAKSAAIVLPGTRYAWGVRVVRAHTSRYTGKGVTVAVLDSGIQRNHPAFSRFDQRSLIEEDFTGEGNGDWSGHGTHCAATLFGGDVDGIRIGVAPGVSKVLIGKVIGQGGASIPSLVAAMEWAVTQGAQVISLSLSLDMVGHAQRMIAERVPSDVAYSQALKAYRENTRLFDTLSNLLGNNPQIGREALFIAAAGNSSRRNETPPRVLSADLPATTQHVIAVGAVDEKFSVAAFSNSDPVLVAPGVKILSAGDRAGLTALSGTSMAVPHVAGCAALWIEQQRAANPKERHPRWLEQLRSALTVRALALPEADSADVGFGLVQAPQ